MTKDFLEKWEKYKNDLEKYFSNTPQEEYNSYLKITKAIFKNVFNREKIDFDLEEIIELVLGDYQGTLVFLIPTKGEDNKNYVITSVGYGSCNVCDTLQSIEELDGGNDIPSLRQVKDYMTLSLHIFQKTKWISEIL